MTRQLDQLDKKIGATIRLVQTKLGLSQMALGEALGLTFQQIQKYEKSTNAIASTRIPTLCKVLKITPNALFSMARHFARRDARAQRLGHPTDALSTTSFAATARSISEHGPHDDGGEASTK